MQATEPCEPCESYKRAMRAMRAMLKATCLRGETLNYKMVAMDVTYARRRVRRTTWCPYWSTYALHTCMEFDIGDPYYSQLTAVKSRYLLTSTT